MNLKTKWIFRIDIKKDVCKNTNKRKQPKEKIVYYLFAENVVTHKLQKWEKVCKEENENATTEEAFERLTLITSFYKYQ